ncbi:MAG: hypothetical protein K6D93_03765 [Saccharofermentans sp.]|nr:hypothetical protein [Saccharofermentans sp.]
MIIETNDKFTKEEMDEVFSVTVKRAQIYKNPEKPLKDPFKEAVGNIIWGVCAFVVNLLLCLFTQSGPLRIICVVAMTLSGVLILVGILLLVSGKKAYRDSCALLEKHDHSKIEFDEAMIGVEMDNGTTVNIRWSEIEFIKVFKATVAIFASDKSRALIIPVKHWDPIAKFMEDNRIMVKFYR